MGLETQLFADRRVKSLARKLARRTAGSEPLPPEIAVPATDGEWPVVAELGRILGVAGYRKGGKAVFAIPIGRRNPADWAELRAAFTRDEPGGGDAGREAFRRARHFAPSEVVKALTADEVVARFVRRGAEEALEFLRLLEWAVKREEDAAPTTLSQAGADILGNSKSLRAGIRREVFRHVLSAVAGMDEEDGGRDVFARFGIEENPFTSNVTVFAPFSFTLENGEEFDHPARLFRDGLATQLPRQTVLRVCGVRFPNSYPHIVTSENAAPFERMVRAGVPCLYTEGYPNAAVVCLLEQFARAGATADHDGDGDLDGFLIADRVAKAIPVVRVLADESADSNTVFRRPVSSRARARWEAYLAAHPDFSHGRALRLALARGWIEQESRVPSPNPMA